MLNSSLSSSQGACDVLDSIQESSQKSLEDDGAYYGGSTSSLSSSTDDCDRYITRIRTKPLIDIERFLGKHGDDDLVSGGGSGDAKLNQSKELYKHLLLNQIGRDEVYRHYRRDGRTKLSESRVDGVWQYSRSDPNHVQHQYYSQQHRNADRDVLSSSTIGYSTSSSSSMNNDNSSLLSFTDTSDFYNDENIIHRDPYSTSPLENHFFIDDQISASAETLRKIAKKPNRILDAPDLLDDFYLNLVDWSFTNIVAVGLTDSLFLWMACNSQVNKLFTIQQQPENPQQRDLITSVKWSPRGQHLAVGFKFGRVEIWDINEGKRIRSLSGHRNRCASLSWMNGQILTSGSRDHSILNRDLRANEHWQTKWNHHLSEVCGLEWSPCGRQLASGGNDNRLLVWQQCMDTPVVVYREHTAAIKAICWSPHEQGLLASGGGTADRHIRFWNTLSPRQSSVRKIDTGCQVCNVAWSPNTNELVSTHGFSLNQVTVWKYPSMQKIQTLTGHTSRVLFLAMSPSGDMVVTGAGRGDETLRFWNIFPPAKTVTRSEGRDALFFSQIPLIR